MLQSEIEPENDMDDSLDEEDQRTTRFTERGYIVRAPKLQRLVASGMHIRRGKNLIKQLSFISHVTASPFSGSEYLETLLRPLSNLVHLDLSNLGLPPHSSGDQWSALLHLKRLAALILYNAPHMEEAFNYIRQIKTLR